MNTSVIADKLISAFDKLLLGQIPDQIESGSDLDDHCNLMIAKANIFFRKFEEASNFIKSMAEGNLDVDPPAKNLIASPFKMLHSNLQHLTWQTQQVAKGDLNQSVHFLGDFSIAFNKMIESLKEKQKMEQIIVESEKQLRELNATKDKFFSIIAHDLKGPLGATNSLIELLVTDYESFLEEEKKEFIEVVYQTSKQTLNLLLNLLDWSRQQRGTIPFEPAQMKLQPMIEENVKLLNLNAEKKKITLEFECEESLEVFADKNMVMTIIRNLVSNSIKFTPESGIVSIKAAKSLDFAEIKIVDNGIGMSEATMEKLFRIDVHHTTRGTNNEEGTGLGLIMCKDFVEKNNGWIFVNSEPEKGTCFTFTLPLSEFIN